ncbi:MAG: NAD(P)-dependent oxidoreductase [Bacteroidota bacterium]|jgi:nucleoside-diphosphate-sugar epimerase|nr:NAD(P)-dependent oxidoreductase [Bacteroidota bacterium]
MKILVTGGAGYKGTVLVRKLLDQGYDVTLLDNFMYGYEPVMHLATRKNLQIIRHDIRNGIPGLKEYDVIFHLAGISGFPACASNPHSAQLINVEATRQIANDLAPGQMLINASTTSLYGKSGVPCNEETHVDPVSTYALTKLAAEEILHEKPNVVSLRFATVFGFSTRMRMDLMVNDFVYKAVKEKVIVLFDSFAKRTFIHVEDAADCYIFTMNHFNSMKGGIYNAGGNNLNFSKDEIAAKIREKVEFSVVNSELRDKDLRHFIVNFDKIEKIGFKPSRTVEEGIDELLRIYSFYEYYSHYRTI